MADYDTTGVPRPGGQLTVGQIDNLREMASGNYIHDFYDYAGSLGSNYGDLAAEYNSPTHSLLSINSHFSRISNAYTTILTRGDFKLGNALANGVALGLMRAYLTDAISAGRLPTTDEIYQQHHQVFENLGIAGSWIGENKFIGGAVGALIGGEPSDPPGLLGSFSSAFRELAINPSTPQGEFREAMEIASGTGSVAQIS